MSFSAALRSRWLLAVFAASLSGQITAKHITTLSAEEGVSINMRSCTCNNTLYDSYTRQLTPAVCPSQLLFACTASLVAARPEYILILGRQGSTFVQIKIGWSIAAVRPELECPLCYDRRRDAKWPEFLSGHKAKIVIRYIVGAMVNFLNSRWVSNNKR